MSNSFADQLRNTQPTPPPQKPDKRTEFRKKQSRTPQRYCDNIISAFKRRCETEARNGKRKAEWASCMETNYGDSYTYNVGYMGWGEKAYAYEYAQEVKALLEAEISRMAFSSYAVSVVSNNSPGFRGKTSYKYGFKIVVRW